MATEGPGELLEVGLIRGDDLVAVVREEDDRGVDHVGQPGRAE